MHTSWRALSVFCGAALIAASAAALTNGPLHLIFIDPGHSHAAGMQSSMLPGFSDEAHIYAPLGPDVIAHMNAVAAFNSRATNPTTWKLSLYAGPDFLERAGREPRGNVVVLAGRNDLKIDYIEAAVRSGQNVLADKPWIIASKDLPRLEAVLDQAERERLVAYDVMTQRFDIAYQLQQALVNDERLLGRPKSVLMESTHYILKSAKRPVWFLDVERQGEGMADVGTHLVDLIEWTLFPGQSIDYRRDVRVTAARHWPIELSHDDFERLTGEREWPEFAKPLLHDGRFAYYANNEVSFAIRGIQARCIVHWNFEEKDGLRDAMLAVYEGSNARVQVRQDKEEKFIPEMDVIPVDTSRREAVRAALEAKLANVAGRYPGLSIADHGAGLRVVIPKSLRTPGGGYFPMLAERFLGYVRDPAKLPAWEKPNMITKYYITTRAVELAREKDHEH
jgi:predicted dehydrogenase